MANMIEELQVKQYGYNIALETVKGAKPKPVEIEKSDDKGNGVTVSYDPAGDTFLIRISGNYDKCGYSLGRTNSSDAKLILEALGEFFKEAVDADQTT